MNEVIHNYALALFQLSIEENKTKEFYDQLKTIETSTQENPEFLKILSLYSIPEAEKYQVVDDTFKDFDLMIKNFLKVASKNHIISKLKYIIEVFNNFYFEMHNIRKGFIYTTIPLSNEEIKKFEDAYSKKHAMKLLLQNVVDPKLLSGIKIVIDDIVIDNSGLHQLEMLKESIIKDKF